MSSDIIDMTAGAIAASVASGKLTAVEVTEAFLARITEVNPTVNAVCTLNPVALDAARAVDARRAAGEAARPLEGVPFLIKDILQTKDLRTTFGSLLLEHDVPSEDTISVERLKAAGGVLLGKTNTPEFAHDINTHNKIFGTTRNPWDVNVTAGGSSGGSGSAVASGMAPIAIGTDLGGSIRIPCSINGLAGIRPSPGRIPYYPTDYGWDTLVQHVQGPMTRDNGDVGLAMSVLTGPDDRDPSSLPQDNMDFLGAASGSTAMAGKRIAYVGDLGGLIPMEPEVDRLVRAGLDRLRGIGCVVEEAHFDASDIRDIVAGTRGFGMMARYADRYDAHKDLMTQQLINQVGAAMQLSVRDVVESERLRTAYWHRVRQFMENYDYIVAPIIGAPPFRLDEALPTQVAGKPVERFLDVYLFTYVFSVTALPIVSVPCGLTETGLPIGMQIVGHRLRDDQVLQVGSAYQHAHPELFTRPEIDLAALKPVSDDMQTTGTVVR